MQHRSPFLDVLVRRFTAPGPRPVSRRLQYSPSFAQPDQIQSTRPAPARPAAPVRPEPWPQEDCANEPLPLHGQSDERAFWTLGARLILAALLAILALPSRAAVREVGAIGITVGDLDRVLPFYTNTLSFALRSITSASGGPLDALLGLTGASTRTAELQLGTERLTLTEHLTNKGRPIPADSRSLDHWFQHIAIVVSDMDAAYEHLRRAKVKHVSTAPQTLPDWNKDAGGIRAFYFRDPEEHVLEIIWFPPGKGDPKWKRAEQKFGAPLFLGIDHTAIVVSDTDRSLAFYTNALGLRVVGGAHNYGTEQEHLNQVFGARLHITALRAERGPGIEFLEYIAPPGGRPLWPGAKASDLAFWQTSLLAPDLREILNSTQATGGTLTSRRPMRSREGGATTVIVRDPDGHALRLMQFMGAPGE